MHSPDIEELAATVVPGEGPVTVRRLGAGLSHSTYQVIREGASYALRTADAARSLPAQREWEIAVLVQAHAAGLAPRLRYAAADPGVLVLDWIAGTNWSEETARHPDSARRIAAMLRAVHALDAPQPARVMNPAGWIELYSATLSAWGLGRASRFAPAAGLALERLQATPAATSVVCHSDVHRLNVLDVVAERGKETLLLLDWEYAHVADAHWDLAGWSANNDLAEPAQRALVSAYWDASPSAAQWESFRLQFWLYDYICLLWMELYGRRRPAELGAVMPRAERLESRLAASVYGTMTR